MEDKKKINRSIYLLPAIWNRVREVAKLEDRSVNNIVKIAIIEYLEKRGV